MKRNTFASTSVAPLVRSGLKQIALSAVLLVGLTLLPALTTQAQVRAWGENNSGQVGDGTSGNTYPTPITLPSALTSDITAFSGGNEHTLALRSDGTVVAWGQNFHGQRGDGTTNTAGCSCNPTPGTVTGLTGVVAISADGFHSLAVRSDGTVWAWGRNIEGQLGDNTTADSSTPIQVGVGVPGFNSIVAVDAGAFHSLALKSDGTVWAWGRNIDFAQVTGNGVPSANVLSPTQVSGVSNVISISAGESHSIVVQGDGNVYGWGSNLFGSLGNGTTTGGGCGCLPVTQSSIIGVAKIAAGFNHTLALKQDGTVWAWGRNFSGELGDGTTTPGPPFGTGTPVQVLNINGIADIRTSGYHSIARRKDGTLFSWGFNASGQVTANGSTSAAEATPVTVPVGTTDAVFGTTYQTSYVSAPNIPTVIGTNVFTPGENFTLSFANVTTGGNTTAQTIDPAAQALTVPTGFQLQNNAVGYNLATTSAFSGNADICLTVPSVQSQVLFNALVLYHGEGGNWVDRTTSRDYRKRQVCGTVTTLGQFALGRPTVVTSAGVMVSGRVLTAGGKPIRNAFVTITDAQGNTRTSVTGLTGYYRFANVTAGGIYIFSVSAKRYTFSQPTQVRSITAETDDINFTADSY